MSVLLIITVLTNVSSLPGRHATATTNNTRLHHVFMLAACTHAQ